MQIGKQYFYQFLMLSQKSKQIIARVFIVIFVLHYANICFFYHSHIINGATIVHSHLHDKAHTQTGTHTGSELTLISTLSNFQSLQATLCFIGFGFFFILQAVTRFFPERKIISQHFTCISLRAPPALF